MLRSPENSQAEGNRTRWVIIDQIGELLIQVEMGLSKQMARFVIREAKHSPIRGSVLLVGRQTIHLTPDRFAELMSEEALPIDPAIPVMVCRRKRTHQQTGIDCGTEGRHCINWVNFRV